MEINLPDVVQEVTAEFQRYERALNENDVDVLNELFWNNSLTLRYGIAEMLYGHEAITAFRSGIAPGTGARRLQNTVITTFGQNYATANTEYIRPGSSTIGRQSHSWVRFPEGWRIAAAHVSRMDNPAK